MKCHEQETNPRSTLTAPISLTSRLVQALLLVTPLLITAPWGASDALAHSDCGISLSTSNINLTWSMGFTSQPIQFTVRKNEARSCDFAITFSKGGAGDYNRRMSQGTARLRYQIYKEATLVNILKEWPDITCHDDAIFGSFSGGRNQSQSMTYYFAIPFDDATTPTLKPAGSYVDTYVLKAYEEANIDSSPDDVATVTVTTTIPKIIQISLVNSGGSFDPNATYQHLDFGTLATGATRSLDLRILSNAGYNVTFTSQNRGVLKHSNASVATSIPYNVRVNGAVFDLNSGGAMMVANASGPSSLSGTNNPIDFTIGSLPDAVAGTYSDTITVTATTRD